MDLAGPLGVSDFLILTATEHASYLKLAKTPRVSHPPVSLEALGLQNSNGLESVTVSSALNSRLKQILTLDSQH